MAVRRVKSSSSLIGAQIFGALLVLLCIALAPPAEGNILLVPVGHQAQGKIAALALAQGASLVQRGPLPSSVIVYGKRDNLFLPLAHAGILMVAGGAVGCRTPKPGVA